MKSAVWIIVMLFIHDAASLKAKSSHLKKPMLRRKSQQRRKLESAPANYKYDESKRSIFQVVTLLLIVIMIVTLLTSESSNGLGKGDSLDTLALLAGGGALLTHMISNTKQLRNRKLKITERRKVYQRTIRKLFSINGIGSLYGNLMKLVKKNGISKVDTKKPNSLFGFVKRILKSELGLKGPLVEKAFNLAKNFLGFAF